MKTLKPFICTLLCAFTTVALAAEPGQPSMREKSVMLYFTKSFGSDQKQNRAPLALGLRLQQSAPFDTTQSIALLDARYSLDGHKSFALAGLNAFESSHESSEGLPGTSSIRRIRKHPGVAATIFALGAVGISCATKNWPCKSSGGYRDPPPTGEPNTPGN
jgi:hypothetical protein